MATGSLRNREVKNAHFRVADELARRYRRGRDTIVLIPGGMGSQLDRSTRSVQRAIPSSGLRYEPLWIDEGILFFGDLLKLMMEPNGDDADGRVVIPNGPLRGLINPYDGTQKYLEERCEYNYVVFAFDWRRPIAESASRLKQFLETVRERVHSLRGEDPLPRTTLLCHSMGGLVAKVFLHLLLAEDPSGAIVRRYLNSLITAATPFHGTIDHMSRYYEGQAAMNLLYGTTAVAKLTGTFPGPYILMYLATEAFERQRQQFADLEGLLRYPVRDKDDPSQAADPYDRKLANRYPSTVDRKHLRRARRDWNLITAKLPKRVIERVFHIRGLGAKMRAELQWKAGDHSGAAPGTFPSPVSQAKAGTVQGDGTVPKWSARLLQTPTERIYDLPKAKDHRSILEYLPALEAVRHVLEHGSFPSTVPTVHSRLGQSRATRPKMMEFIEGIVAKNITRSDALVSDPKMWRRLIEEMCLC